MDPQPNYEFAIEVARVWIGQLRGKNWNERLIVIADLFEYMRESIRDLDDFAEVFPIAVAEIICGLNEPQISCVEQAHLWANSSDARHRDAAGIWLRQNKP